MISRKQIHLLQVSPSFMLSKLPVYLQVVFLLCFALVLALIPSPTIAAGYIVNTLNDDTFNDSFCTLREAILSANNTPENPNCGTVTGGDDIITFNVDGTINLEQQLPDIEDRTNTGSLIIDGGGNIIVSGNDTVRIFHVKQAANLTLKNLTISNANSGVGKSGGGLLSEGGDVTILNSTFSDNYSYIGGGLCNEGQGTIHIVDSIFSNNTGTFGGGLCNTGGKVIIENSTFTKNHGGSGGGISSVGGLNDTRGKVVISSSTFSENQADFGGGIYNGNASLQISASTFSENTAALGAGISNAKKGMTKIVNSTFANNLAFEGGGISNSTRGSQVSIVNSTFSGNQANSQGAGVTNSNKSTMILKNTIIANSNNGGNCSGNFLEDSTHNLSTDSSCGDSFNVVSPTELNLGVLTSMPAYFPLGTESKAIDAGNNKLCATEPVNNKSQNGVIRPQDGDNSGLAICDIGSFEAPTPPCSSQPDTPILKRPPDGATLHDSQPILKWNPAFCAANYTIYIQRTKNGHTVESRAALTRLRFKPNPLAPGKSYQWFVLACNEFGCVPSLTRVFTVAP